jgi:tight adherence protein C
MILSVVLVGAVWLITSGWRQPRPLLTIAVRRLRRQPSAAEQLQRTSRGDLVALLGSFGTRSSFVRHHLGSLSALQVIGRPLNVHAGYLIVAAIVGLVGPSLALVLLSLAGVVSLGVVIPAGLSLLGMAAAPLIVHSGAVAEADEVRIDLRHQLSAYLDMMTMLLAGNTGHEGALEQAAAAGDGLLFRELRRRMREVSTTGNSLVTALSLVATDFDLAELEQVASAAALSAAEGAPVARTLAAKCSTLRSTLAADDEAKARVRNDKVTPPLVGMALLFMALIIYPALNLG